MASEGGEHHAALARLVAMVEQVTGHAVSLPFRSYADIRGQP
jgi:hypothetical protein